MQLGFKKLPHPNGPSNSGRIGVRRSTRAKSIINLAINENIAKIIIFHLWQLIELHNVQHLESDAVDE